MRVTCHTFSRRVWIFLFSQLRAYILLPTADVKLLYSNILLHVKQQVSDCAVVLCMFMRRL